MVPAPEVKKQLKRIGADFRFWGLPELRELPKILFDNEQIEHVVNGRYSGGFATLCVTNIRVLLIDKKPLFLTLEDVRYDMVSDVMFNHRLINASIIIGTVHNSITFMGFNKTKFRDMTNYIQQRVMEYRRHQAMHQLNGETAIVEPQLEAYQPQPFTEPVFQQQTTPTVRAEAVNYQPTSVGSIATAAASAATNPSVVQQLPINPYKMPIMIRRRSARFY